MRINSNSKNKQNCLSKQQIIYSFHQTRNRKSFCSTKIQNQCGNFYSMVAPLMSRAQTRQNSPHRQRFQSAGSQRIQNKKKLLQSRRIELQQSKKHQKQRQVKEYIDIKNKTLSLQEKVNQLMNNKIQLEGVVQELLIGKNKHEQKYMQLKQQINEKDKEIYELTQFVQKLKNELPNNHPQYNTPLIPSEQKQYRIENLNNRNVESSHQQIVRQLGQKHTLLQNKYQQQKDNHEQIVKALQKQNQNILDEYHNYKNQSLKQIKLLEAEHQSLNQRCQELANNLSNLSAQTKNQKTQNMNLLEKNRKNENVLKQINKQLQFMIQKNQCITQQYRAFKQNYQRNLEYQEILSTEKDNVIQQLQRKIQQYEKENEEANLVLEGIFYQLNMKSNMSTLIQVRIKKLVEYVRHLETQKSKNNSQQNKEKFILQQMFKEIQQTLNKVEEENCILNQDVQFKMKIISQLQDVIEKKISEFSLIQEKIKEFKSREDQFNCKQKRLFEDINQKLLIIEQEKTLNNNLKETVKQLQLKSTQIQQQSIQQKQKQSSQIIKLKQSINKLQNQYNQYIHSQNKTTKKILQQNQQLYLQKQANSQKHKTIFQTNNYLNLQICKLKQFNKQLQQLMSAQIQKLIKEKQAQAEKWRKEKENIQEAKYIGNEHDIQKNKKIRELKQELSNQRKIIDQLSKNIKIHQMQKMYLQKQLSQLKQHTLTLINDLQKQYIEPTQCLKQKITFLEQTIKNTQLVQKQMKIDQSQLKRQNRQLLDLILNIEQDIHLQAKEGHQTEQYLSKLFKKLQTLKQYYIYENQTHQQTSIQNYKLKLEQIKQNSEHLNRQKQEQNKYQLLLQKDKLLQAQIDNIQQKNRQVRDQIRNNKLQYQQLERCNIRLKKQLKTMDQRQSQLKKICREFGEWKNQKHKIHDNLLQKQSQLVSYQKQLQKIAQKLEQFTLQKQERQKYIQQLQNQNKNALQMLSQVQQEVKAYTRISLKKQEDFSAYKQLQSKQYEELKQQNQLIINKYQQLQSIARQKCNKTEQTIHTLTQQILSQKQQFQANMSRNNQIHADEVDILLKQIDNNQHGLHNLKHLSNQNQKLRQLVEQLQKSHSFEIQELQTVVDRIQQLNTNYQNQLHQAQNSILSLQQKLQYQKRQAYTQQQNTNKIISVSQQQTNKRNCELKKVVEELKKYQNQLSVKQQLINISEHQIKQMTKIINNLNYKLQQVDKNYVEEKVKSDSLSKVVRNFEDQAKNMEDRLKQAQLYLQQQMSFIQRQLQSSEKENNILKHQIIQKIDQNKYQSIQIQRMNKQMENYLENKRQLSKITADYQQKYQQLTVKSKKMTQNLQQLQFQVSQSKKSKQTLRREKFQFEQNCTKLHTDLKSLKDEQNSKKSQTKNLSQALFQSNNENKKIKYELQQTQQQNNKLKQLNKDNQHFRTQLNKFLKKISGIKINLENFSFNLLYKDNTDLEFVQNLFDCLRELTTHITQTLKTNVILLSKSKNMEDNITKIQQKYESQFKKFKDDYDSLYVKYQKYRNIAKMHKDKIQTHKTIRTNWNIDQLSSIGHQ